MNEFYNPANQNRDNQTMYDEPADEIKIVVDDNSGGYCSRCGNPLEANDAFCSKCGAKTYGDREPYREQSYSDVNSQRAARHMGQAVNQQQAPSVVNNYYYNSNNTNNSVNTNVNMNGRMKNKTVALLLCIFFGYLGVHRFYEGKIISGILWACTGGLGGVGWFIDIIRILFKPHYYNP